MFLFAFVCLCQCTSSLSGTRVKIKVTPGEIIDFLTTYISKKAVLRLKRRGSVHICTFVCVMMCGFVCTQPSTGLLWSSPGVQLRVTARCLGSVIWSKTGGSGRSEWHSNNIIKTTCTCLPTPNMFKQKSLTNFEIILRKLLKYSSYTVLSVVYACWKTCRIIQCMINDLTI